jgi:hypothetical protein
MLKTPVAIALGNFCSSRELYQLTSCRGNNTDNRGSIGDWFSVGE